MLPSPSLGPPLLSESPSPPLFWGMPLLAGGAGFATGGAGFATGGAGLGADFGAGCGFAVGGAAGAAGCDDDEALPWPVESVEIWLPAGETANQEAPNAMTPWPVVWPG